MLARQQSDGHQRSVRTKNATFSYRQLISISSIFFCKLSWLSRFHPEGLFSIQCKHLFNEENLFIIHEFEVKIQPQLTKHPLVVLKKNKKKLFQKLFEKV